MNVVGLGGQPCTYRSTGRKVSTPCTTLYTSYMPPELAQEPMEMTQRGSIIWSWSRLTTGTILMKTVPATTMTSASRGDPRTTSEPKRAKS